MSDQKSTMLHSPQLLRYLKSLGLMPLPPQMKEEVQLAELDGLLTSTSHQALRERLHSCRGHIETLFRALQASLNSSEAASSNQVLQTAPPLDLPPQGTPTPPLLLYETIDTYALDQTSKFLKLYLTVAGLTADDLDKVTCSYTDRGLDLRIQNVRGNNFRLVEEDLAHRIKPKDSRFKVQDGTLVLFLAKADPKVNLAVVSTSASRQSALPNHFGRTELKVLLNEYYRIRDSNVYRTPEYPLAASIKEFMTSQGYYDVIDVTSANSALESFAEIPPKAVVVNFSSVAKTATTKKLMTKLVTALAAAPGCKLMFTCSSFMRPDQHSIYSHLLDLMVKGSCEPTHFSARINLTDVRRLPATLYKLGVGVANAEDAAAVTRMTLPKNLQTLGVCVSRKVKPEDLNALPNCKHPVQIFFYGMTKNDIVWIVNCVDKLMGLRTCWLNFPNCQLSPTAIHQVIQSFFARSCPLQFSYQFFASMGLPVQLIPPQFQNPPTQMHPPVLGQHPFIPKLKVCGVLGAAFESPHLSRVSKQNIQRSLRVLGCQVRWAVKWADAE